MSAHCGSMARSSFSMGRHRQIILPSSLVLATTMLLRGSFLILATGCLSAALPLPEIPSFLKICHRNDPRLNDCIKESVIGLKPYLKNGIEVLRIPACDPLRLEEIEIEQSSGPIYIHAIYNNVSVFGGSNFVPKTIRLDVEKNRLKLKLYIPRLEMRANYYLEGRIMMLPITGDGISHGNFTDIETVVTLQFERYRDEATGLTHQRVDDIYVDFEIGHAVVYLDNLFDGDETLAAAMNLFLNDNWSTVIAEIKPKLEETIARLIRDFTNTIFEVFPEDVLLPP